MRKVFNNYNAIGIIPKFMKILFYRFVNFCETHQGVFIFNKEVKQLNIICHNKNTPLYYSFYIYLIFYYYFSIPLFITYKLLNTDVPQLKKALFISQSDKQIIFLFLLLIFCLFSFYRINTQLQSVKNSYKSRLKNNYQKFEFEEQKIIIIKNNNFQKHKIIRYFLPLKKKLLCYRKNNKKTKFKFKKKYFYNNFYKFQQEN
ncbi:unnamed protein product [Paramecium primaurelia]|uniref:Transmembrane protein n=1 Tax=Paramecium primaurelia TaxID=5886 RepID=A0A8S1L1K1_PARPR|nr:unnamed protein product [Paramecium primaurelia]